MKTLPIHIGLVIALGATATSAWAQAVAPAPVPMNVESLKRPSPNWDVRTTIWLTAEANDAATGLKFNVSSRPQKGTLICNQDCAAGECQTREKQPIDPAPGTTLTCRCEYYPIPGMSGDDHFNYEATLVASGKVTARSQPARVDIDIRTRGLRWELIPGGSTGLTSDVNSPSDVPSIFGKNAQDFEFVLSWVTDFPDREISETFTKNFKARGFATAAAALDPDENRFRVTDDDLIRSVSKSLNVNIRTGLVTTPMTVEAVDRGTTSEAGGAAAPAPAAAGENVVSMRRVFTVGADANLNAVWKFDSHGNFIELGAVGKGNFDVATETDSAEIKADRLFELLRNERGTFRWEGGLRFAVKTEEEDKATTLLVNEDGRVENGRNAKEIFVFEALAQRNDALAGLPAADGESQNRWLFRFTATPDLPKLTSKIRPMFGMEVSRAMAGGEKVMRFIYGTNLGIK